MDQKYRFTILGVLVVLVAAIFFLFDIALLLKNILSWIESLGVWGPVIFILLYIVATVLFVPGTVFTLGGGLIFGVVYGSIWVSIGSTLGAAAAFLVGRYVARDWIHAKLGKLKRFAAIDDAVGRDGWKIVGLTRLSPVFPFNLINYAFGLTKISFKEYFIASWIGMLPATVLYVYIGSLAGEIATLGISTSRTPLEWGFYIFGLIVTVIVTVYATRLAKRALNEKIQA